MALALLAGCGAGAPTPPPEPTPMAESPCDPRRLVGLFEIERTAEYTAVSGAVAAAAAPFLEKVVVASEGGCQLLRRNNAFCSPPCPTGTLCAQDGTCLPYPENVNVGTVSVLGLKKSVRMEPRLNNQYFDTSLPAAAFDEGATLRLEASGGSGPRFSLAARGIALLELGGSASMIAADRDLAITWAPGQVPARVLVGINIDQHGTTPVTLTCDIPDTGQATLQAALVARLIGFGVSGFPSLTVTRQAAASTDIPAGCVGFHVISAEQQALKVTGHTPCRSDADCPTDRACDLSRETCEPRS